MTLTDFEKIQIRQVCKETIAGMHAEHPCLLGVCKLSAGSMFRLGGLGWAGFRRRWSDETRELKAQLARDYAVECTAELLREDETVQ